MYKLNEVRARLDLCSRIGSPVKSFIHKRNAAGSDCVFSNRTQLPRGGLSPRRARAGVVFFLGRLPAVGLGHLLYLPHRPSP
jgi:hypothetical protein